MNTSAAQYLIHIEGALTKAVYWRLAQDVAAMRRDGVSEVQILQFKIMVEQQFEDSKGRLLAKAWEWLDCNDIGDPPTTRQ